MHANFPTKTETARDVDYVMDNFSVVDRVSVSGWMMVMMLHHLHGVAGGTVLLSVGRNILKQIVLLNYDWMLSTLKSEREVGTDCNTLLGTIAKLIGVKPNLSHPQEKFEISEVMKGRIFLQSKKKG